MLAAREKQPFVAAVDCPSGIDCDTGGAAAEALPADLTVTLAAAKPGLFAFPGAGLIGELVLGDIGLPEDFALLAQAEVQVAEKAVVRGWLPCRPKDAHKGTFGRAMVIAGSVNYPGAAALAGEAAYRVGAGLVTLAVPSVLQGMLVPQLPEATWLLLPHEMGAISEAGAAVVEVELGKCQCGVDRPRIRPGRDDRGLPGAAAAKRDAGEGRHGLCTRGWCNSFRTGSPAAMCRRCGWAEAPGQARALA